MVTLMGLKYDYFRLINKILIKSYGFIWKHHKYYLKTKFYKIGHSSNGWHRLDVLKEALNKFLLADLFR